MSTSIKEINDECVRGRGRPRDEVARARILEAALELLEELGFASATTDAIAERAGASKATIYRWWPNKSAVLIEALREAVAQELPFPDTGDLREDLRVQLENFVKLLTGRRGRIFKAFIAAAQSDPEVAAAFRSVWMQPRRATTKAVLERHQQGGRLAKELDLDLVLDLLYGPLYFRLLAGHGELTAGYADAIAELALQGLLDCSGQQ
jgi:AcrR family transcriptional regulator